MSPPIYTPDGQEVTEIVLPDGSTASEVVAPDGSVVFEAGPDIPDSVVARDPDDNSNVGTSAAFGLKFTTTVDWPDFQARISGNNSSFSTAYLETANNDPIATLDVSSNSTGDVITFNGVDLPSANDYYLSLDNDGSSWTAGYDGDPTFSYASSDGQLGIAKGYRDSTGETTSFIGGFDKIGNINL